MRKDTPGSLAAAYRCRIEHWVITVVISLRFQICGEGEEHTGLDLSVKCSFQASNEIHLKSISIFDHVCIHWKSSLLACLQTDRVRSRKLTEDLVRFAKSKAQPKLLHKLPILFRPLAPHIEIWLPLSMKVAGDKWGSRCRVAMRIQVT
jgi:hypothetical protein